MCRNIRTLFNFEPPATELEIRDASLQFVRKLSGFNVPSKANEAAFNRAVEQVAASARGLMASLVTSAEPRNRGLEAAKAKARSAEVWQGTKEESKALWARATDEDSWRKAKEESHELWLKAKQESHAAWVSAQESSHKAWDKAADISYREWEKAKAAVAGSQAAPEADKADAQSGARK